MAWEAVMTEFTPDRVLAKRKLPWASLFEERFTNIDLVMLGAAVLLTGFIGLISGAALVR